MGRLCAINLWILAHASDSPTPATRGLMHLSPVRRNRPVEPRPPVSIVADLLSFPLERGHRDPGSPGWRSAGPRCVPAHVGAASVVGQRHGTAADQRSPPAYWPSTAMAT